MASQCLDTVLPDGGCLIFGWKEAHAGGGYLLLISGTQAAEGVVGGILYNGGGDVAGCGGSKGWVEDTVTDVDHHHATDGVGVPILGQLVTGPRGDTQAAGAPLQKSDEPRLLLSIQHLCGCHLEQEQDWCK